MHMFRILTIKDIVRVPPIKMNMPVEKGVKESLEESLEGDVDQNLGVFLCVTDILEIGEGIIVPEDACIHYPVTYKVLVFTPEVNEVVIGEVIDITEFGAFVRIGSIDALAHISQIMDERISYDSKNAILTGMKSGKKLKEGAIVRARIVGVSLGKGKTKVALTLRQPWLGSIEWIEKEKRKQQKGE